MTQTSALTENDLPPQLAELQELIGLQLTLQLVERIGGTRIHVPKTLDTQWLPVKIVGHAAAAAIVQRYGGEDLNIAKASAALRRRRNIEIARRHENGATIFMLAIEYSLTMRQVFNILKHPETLRDSPQVRLFD